MSGERVGQLTTAQEDELRSLNDNFGVATWRLQPDGVLVVVCDDGDTAHVNLGGEVEWWTR